MDLLWKLRDALTLEPIALAYLCDTHPETGWLEFPGWRQHVFAAHPNERAGDIAVAYRNSARANGHLRLGWTIRHT